MNWVGKEHDNKKYIGFVYKITNIKSNEYYIGKKLIKRLKNGEWNTATNKYQGSGALKHCNPEDLHKEILTFCYTKTQMAVIETKLIIQHIYDDPDVLCKNEMINLRVRIRK